MENPPDPNTFVAVESLTITHGDERRWRLTTRAVILDGRKFTAVKEWDDLDELLGFIRQLDLDGEGGS